MLNLDLLYTIREKIPKNVRRILPKIIRRQIDKSFFKYYFLKTNFKNLPHLNYPEKGNLEYQKELMGMKSQREKTLEQNEFKKKFFSDGTMEV